MGIPAQAGNLRTGGMCSDLESPVPVYSSVARKETEGKALEEKDETYYARLCLLLDLALTFTELSAYIHSEEHHAHG